MKKRIDPKLRQQQIENIFDAAPDSRYYWEESENEGLLDTGVYSKTIDNGQIINNKSGRERKFNGGRLK